MTDLLQLRRDSAEVMMKEPDCFEDKVIVYLESGVQGDWQPDIDHAQRWDCVKWLLHRGYMVLDGGGYTTHQWTGVTMIGDPFCEVKCDIDEAPMRMVASLKK